MEAPVGLEHKLCALESATACRGKRLRNPEAKSDRGKRRVAPDMRSRQPARGERTEPR